MPYALGVDIGTSTLTTATYRLGDRDEPIVRSLELDAGGGPISTMVVSAADGRTLAGKAATAEAAVHPERSIRGWSRRVGDTVPIAVGDALVAPELIFAAFAHWAVVQAERLEGAAPAAVCVSHPTGWGDHRISLLRNALAGAWLEHAVLVDEVQAVAEQHRATVDSAGGKLGVYDLSADRLTFSLIGSTEGGEWMRLGGETVDGVAGARFDDAVLAHVIASAGDVFARFDATAAGSMADMRVLRDGCTAAKETLSSETEASVGVALNGESSDVRMTRDALELAIESTVRSTVRVVQETHRRADPSVDSLGHVVLVGGAARSPLVRDVLIGAGARVTSDDDPQATIALGAARIAAARIDWSAAVEEPPVAESTVGATRASLSRAYLTAVGAVGSFARRTGSALRRPAVPADEPAPVESHAVDTPPVVVEPTVAADEFERLIAPHREDERAVRRESIESTEAAR